ncbi:hypothetical protein CTI14_06835 [Methylobacterium radiotolerans]|nr:hypothetical protein CTI14_06835 [Methylobacterium radiotolerans]
MCGMCYFAIWNLPIVCVVSRRMYLSHVAAPPPMTQPPAPEIDIYERLRTYIKRTGKTQRQIAEEAGIPQPSYLSHMVNGRVNWVESHYFSHLASALGLTFREIQELRPDSVTQMMAAALQIGADLASDIMDPDQSARDLVKMGAYPINGRYPVPVLGDVAAGGRNDTFVSIEEAEEEIDVGYDLARRYGLSNLYGLRVNGDSMYSERVRFSVPNGSTLIVHREMQPTRGDLVIAYIEDLDLGVVKEYGEPEDVALSSYNPRGPIYRANEHRIRICGVVVEVRFRPHVRPMH